MGDAAPLPPVHLILGHQRADLDAAAGQLGLGALAPGALLCAPGGLARPAEEALRQLGLLDGFVDERAVADAIGARGLGVVWIADTARAERLGALSSLVEGGVEVLCWDTHPVRPGDLPRAPGPAAAAACAQVCARLIEAGVTPPPAVATALLLGVHEDSGHFLHPSTTAADHAAAAACLGWGADLARIGALRPVGLSPAELDLVHALRSRAEIEQVGALEVAFAVIELDGAPAELGPAVAAARAAGGWAALILLAESTELVHVIARGDERIDLGEVLGAVGGGGHAAAAAARVPGLGVAELRARLRDALRGAMGPPLTVADRMVRTFLCLPGALPAHEGLRRLRAAGVHAAPVDEDGALLHQISEAELEAATRKGLGAAPIAGLAVHPIPYLRPEAPLRDVDLVAQPGRGRVLLVGEPPSGAVGLITRSTLLSAQARPARAPRRRPPAPQVVVGLLRAALGGALARVDQIAAVAAELGLGLFLVGGPVRDLLLHRPVRDVDLMVEGEGGAARLGRALAQRFGGTLLVHEAFLTAKWRPTPDEELDLATARAETYPELAALPEVRASSVEQDLVRRDFTVNAMAVELTPDRRGQIIDPFGGWGDLQDGVLRALHGMSLQDDPTRALRAARFCGRFGLHLAPGTRGLMTGLVRAGTLSRLGLERLGHELQRIFVEPAPEPALRLLGEWGLLGALHPRLRPDARALEQLRLVIDEAGHRRADRGRCAFLWLSTLLDGVDREAMLRIVPGDRHDQRRFVEGPGRVAGARRALGAAGADRGLAGRVLQGLDSVELCLLAAAIQGRDPTPGPELALVQWWWEEGRAARAAVDGHALIAAGLTAGPGLKLALQAALEEAWRGASPEAQRAAALAIQP